MGNLQGWNIKIMLSKAGYFRSAPKPHQLPQTLILKYSESHLKQCAKTILMSSRLLHPAQSHCAGYARSIAVALISQMKANANTLPVQDTAQLTEVDTCLFDHTLQLFSNLH